MESNLPQYPIKKTDHLGRLLYVDWNGIERTIYKYWGETKKVKVKYRLFNEESSFDAYDMSGKTIMSYASGTFEISLPRLWSGPNNDLGFKVAKSKLLSWNNMSKGKDDGKLFVAFDPFNLNSLEE